MTIQWVLGRKKATPKELAKALTEAAVSYTHLDVYKRQAVGHSLRQRGVRNLPEFLLPAGLPGNRQVQLPVL